MSRGKNAHVTIITEQTTAKLYGSYSFRISTDGISYINGPEGAQPTLIDALIDALTANLDELKKPA